jgi:hypothetical protein
MTGSDNPFWDGHLRMGPDVQYGMWNQYHVHLYIYTVSSDWLMFLKKLMIILATHLLGPKVLVFGIGPLVLPVLF